MNRPSEGRLLLLAVCGIIAFGLLALLHQVFLEVMRWWVAACLFWLVYALATPRNSN